MLGPRRLIAPVFGIGLPPLADRRGAPHAVVRGCANGSIASHIARGWSLPQQRSASGPGYVELKRGTCGGSTRIAGIRARRVTIATACKRGHTYQLLYHKATVPTT